MTMSAHWENTSKTIVRFQLQRGWSWKDLHAALDRTAQLAALSNNRIDAIIDVCGCESAKPVEMFTLDAIESARAFARRAGTIDYTFTLVGAPPAIKALYHTHHIAYVGGTSHVQFAPNVDHARNVLEKDRLRDILYAVLAPA